MNSRSANQTNPQRSIVLTLALVLCLASYAQAGLAVVNLNRSYPMGTGQVAIPIFVTGSDVVNGVALNMEIADPSFVTGSGNWPAGPSPWITFQGNTSPYAETATGDYTNNFMNGVPHFFVPDNNDDNWNSDNGEALSTSGQNIPANRDGGGGAGLLLTLLVDFSDQGGGGDYHGTPGTWRIIMDAENAFGAIQFARTRSGNQELVPVDLTHANFTVTLVPEPGSMVLGSFAAADLGMVALRKRRARPAWRSERHQGERTALAACGHASRWPTGSAAMVTMGDEGLEPPTSTV